MKTSGAVRKLYFLPFSFDAVSSFHIIFWYSIFFKPLAKRKLCGARLSIVGTQLN